MTNSTNSKQNNEKIQEKHIPEEISALRQVQYEDWCDPTRNQEERENFLNAIYKSYHNIIDEFYVSANKSAELFTQLSKKHKRWRWTIIIFTGFVVVVNLIAAYVVANFAKQGSDGGSSPAAWPLAAAIVAALLAILANLENFANPLERSQQFRESREIFLTAAREFEGRWKIYVVPYWPEAEACINAAELYPRLLTRDSELRAKLRELTVPRKS